MFVQRILRCFAGLTSVVLAGLMFVGSVPLASGHVMQVPAPDGGGRHPSVSAG